MTKRVRIAIALFCVALVAGMWLLYRRDHYIRDAIQTYGSVILGVKVTLKKARLDITGQSIELQGLSIGSPPHFKGLYLLQLDNITVKLDVSSLVREVVLIREISILKPDIIYERIGGVSNFDIVQRNAEKFALAPTPVPGKKSNKPEKRWIISSLVVRDGKAVVLTDMVITQSLTVAIPNLHLKDIGKRSNGATTADATKQVMTALTASVSNAAGAALAGLVKGVGKELGKGVKGIGGVLKSLFGK